MFVSRGDRDLGVAILMNPGSQSLYRGEAKDSTLLFNPHHGYRVSVYRDSFLRGTKSVKSWEERLEGGEVRI